MKDTLKYHVCIILCCVRLGSTTEIRQKCVFEQEGNRMRLTDGCTTVQVDTYPDGRIQVTFFQFVSGSKERVGT